MFVSLFSTRGQFNRSVFVRAAVVVVGLCLLLLVGIAQGGVSMLAAKLGQPVAPTNPIADVILQVLALTIVVFLPAPVILKRLRDIGLPPMLTFSTIALAESVVSGMMPHTAGSINGPFAALAVLTAILALLSLAPGNEAAAAVDPIAEAWQIERLAQDWMSHSGDNDRRNDATFSPDDRLPGDAALEYIPAEAPVPTFPDYSKGEGFGRRLGDRR